MKKRLAVLVLLSLQFAAAQLTVPNRPLLTEDTVIHIPEASAHPALHDLLGIAFDNHIPMSIIVGEADAHPDTDICQYSLVLMRGDMTIAELIRAIEAAGPYRAKIQNGVLEVSPVTPSADTAHFLNMRLAHFKSGAGDHQSLGIHLWQWVRVTLSPGVSTDFSHLGSLSAETVKGINATDVNVKTILDTVVGEGNGGVWVLNASRTKALSADSPMPFEVYGFMGKENRPTVTNLGCSR
jgi:hypothetical protein